MLDFIKYSPYIKVRNKGIKHERYSGKNSSQSRWKDCSREC